MGKKIIKMDMSTLGKVQKKTKEAITFEQAESSFSKWIIVRGLTKATHTNYMKSTKKLRLFLIDNDHMDVINDISEMTEEIFSEFIMKLLENDYSKNTINLYIRSLRAFENYLIKKKMLTNSFIGDRKELKRKRDVQFIPSKSQVSKLLDILQKNISGFTSFRLLVATNLMLEGLRVSEVVGLKAKNYSKEDGFLTIDNTKNGYVRRIPIQKRTMELLDIWIDFRKKQELDHEYMLYSNTSKPLDKTTIQRDLKNVCKGDDDLKEITCHSLRRYRACELILKGKSLYVVCQMMGWRDLNMVNTYVSLSGVELKNMVD